MVSDYFVLIVPFVSFDLDRGLISDAPPHDEANKTETPRRFVTLMGNLI